MPHLPLFRKAHNDLQKLKKTCRLRNPITFKVTPDFGGCPRGKNSYVRHLKGKQGKLYIVGKLNKCRFWKKYKLPVSLTPQKKMQTTAKMTMCHSIELIGYQIQAHWQNNCTVLIKKDQLLKLCQHFSIF